MRLGMVGMGDVVSKVDTVHGCGGLGVCVGHGGCGGHGDCGERGGLGGSGGVLSNEYAGCGVG